MNHTHMTLEEKERAAYMDGDTRTAELLAQAQGLEDLESQTGEDVENIPAMVEVVQDAGGIKQLVKKLEDLEHLREFFDTCFSLLADHYPCSSVISDYDKGVVYDAIRRGKGLGYTIDQIADACNHAEIPDPKFESVSIYLKGLSDE